MNLTRDIADSLRIQPDDVHILTSARGSVRVYAPAGTDRERLQGAFLAASGGKLKLVVVGHDDDGVFVGYEVAS